MLALAVALPLSIVGCGGSSGGAKASAGKTGKADGGKKAADDGAKAADDDKGGDEMHLDPAAEAGDEKAGDEAHVEPLEAGAEEAGADAADTKADAADATGGTTAGAAAAEAGAEEGKAEAGAEDGGSTGAAGPDKKALLAEVAKRRTTDERANEALAEAEAAGATPKELARAAHKRGKALFAKPDRAKVFFQWALEKDEKYADPVFELAKQEVNTGELDAAKEHLEEVGKRKGKKLLQQIDYDPMWEVIKDDPEIRALVEG